MKEIIGNKYNHLLVIERAEDYIRKCDGKHRPMYKCLCDCGKTKVILGRSIVNGTTKSYINMVVQIKKDYTQPGIILN